MDLAKVGYVVVCEDVFNDGEVFLKKPYNVITPYSVPGNFSFVLAFSMFELETDVKYKLRVEVIQPSKTNLIEQEMDFEFTPPKDQEVTEPPTSGGVNLKFNNVIFKQPGIHTFKVTINGQSTGKLMVPVFASGQ